MRRLAAACLKWSSGCSEGDVVAPLDALSGQRCCAKADSAFGSTTSMWDLPVDLSQSGACMGICLEMTNSQGKVHGHSSLISSPITIDCSGRTIGFVSWEHERKVRRCQLDRVHSTIFQKEHWWGDQVELTHQGVEVWKEEKGSPRKQVIQVQ